MRDNHRVGKHPQLRVQFTADPYAVFAKSDSPLAIHGRQRWLKDDACKDADRAVAKLQKSQSDDGSWPGSVRQTVESLFALWLLGRRSAATAAGVDWLLEVGRPPMRHVNYSNLFFGAHRSDVDSLREVPFSKGCSGFVKTGAALFLASVLEQGDEQRVSDAFDTLGRLPAKRGGRWCSASCSNNILQAYAANRRFSDSAAMRLAVKRLEADQTATGAWADQIPFYATFYALSQVPLKSADAQFRRALPRIIRNQRLDGTWGNNLINTFLVLDALERKGIGV